MKNLRFATLLLLFSSGSAFLNAQQSLTALESFKALAPSDILSEILIPIPKTPAKTLKDFNGLSGERLFQYLHAVTAPKRIDASSGYTYAKGYMYSVSSNITYNGRHGLLPIYSRIFIPGNGSNGNAYRESGDINNDGYSGDFINCEHVWPQSFFNQNYPMRADLHHLYPSLSVPNGKRSNFPFANLSDSQYSTTCGTKMDDGKFQPCPASKGNIARALLYFMVRYYDKNIRNMPNYNSFWISKVPLFLEWNRQDPPDANEIKRNDLIEKFQGNRNPFIDMPGLADKIGVQVFQSH